MKQYLGVKLVKAEPANRGEDPGYFVQYSDGYTSWSPKGVFEEAYREVVGLTFGLALEAMKKGAKVRCHGWTQGRHLEYSPEGEYTFPCIKEIHVSGHVNIWLPHQIDLLADDWYIVEAS